MEEQHRPHFPQATVVDSSSNNNTDAHCDHIDGLSECYYLMGEVHRFKALVEKKGSTARESEQNACITCVNKAIELYQYVDQQRLYTRMCQYTRHSSHTATQQTCPGA